MLLNQVINGIDGETGAAKARYTYSPILVYYSNEASYQHHPASVALHSLPHLDINKIKCVLKDGDTTYYGSVPEYRRCQVQRSEGHSQNEAVQS